MRLSDGAEAIRGDLPASSTRVVDVPMEAGDELGSGLPRLGSLRLVRDRVREALDDVEGWPLLIGGDCGAELAAVERAASDGTVAVVWFDAHPDLNTPESSTSGAFGGMVLRTLLGDGVDALVPAVPLKPGLVVVAGSRSTDDSEEQYLLSSGIARVGADPSICETAALPGDWGALSYWRLHGSPVVYRSSYRDRIDHYGRQLHDEAARGRRVWCIFDNTASSAGVSDAQALLLRTEVQDLQPF